VNTSASNIFSIQTIDEFEEISLSIFRQQAKNCIVYKSYIENLGINPIEIYKTTDIPFLPIGFFKSHSVISDSSREPEQVFSSSGTTGQKQSQHYVTDVAIYEQSFNAAFKEFYGDPQEICILALLPSYLERDGSSLIYMVDDLIKQSKHPKSGYFLHNHEELKLTLDLLKENNQKTLLIGVTYALLDFIERYTLNFPNLIVMETGGMKGKRKEMVREELHALLTAGFGIESIHSEYGMTELLSQAYSFGKGIFKCPSWMKVLLRDPNDPLSLVQNNQTGGLNIIDLANINSCSFIATQDLGRMHAGEAFEVIGRFDNADIRGCNLMVL
jgi:phenylacetate-coenzyme A ligase PaaK-like adenylate-forming protein